MMAVRNGVTPSSELSSVPPRSSGTLAERIEVRNLFCGYHKTQIVHEVSFTIGKGEFVCIIGANGCGKTTLLKTLLGLLPSLGGSIELGGRDLRQMKEKDIARFFAYIPQAHRPPFPFSVADVIILGRTPYINALAQVSDADRLIAYEAMELLGISDLAEHTYTELSGGQQQLVLIARALTQQPRFLIMDEPTASLDFGNQQTVLSRMRTLSTGGTSVIMVTHDPDHALFCADRVIMMEDGAITGDGPTPTIITTENLQRIYGKNVVVLDVELPSGQRTQVCVPVPE